MSQKERKLVLVGVDNGNANTKTANMVFTSGVAVHDDMPPMTSNVLKYQDKYYTMSSNRKTYLRDKTEDVDTFILTLFAIAQELEFRELDTVGVDIKLGVGLPPGHYDGQKDKFKDYFYRNGRNINFTYNGKYHEIRLDDVLVLPQALAAAVLLPINKDYSQTYVVDIGGYTVDVVALVGGKPDYDRRETLNKGIITMTNSIAKKISSSVGYDVEEAILLSFLRGEPTLLKDDVKNMILDEYEVHAKGLIDDLAERGIDLSLSPSLFVGGGSLILEDSIKKSDKVALAKFSDDITINARGYETLLTFANSK